MRTRRPAAVNRPRSSDHRGSGREMLGLHHYEDMLEEWAKTGVNPYGGREISDFYLSDPGRLRRTWWLLRRAWRTLIWGDEWHGHDVWGEEDE